MINPNGGDFRENEPAISSTRKPEPEQISAENESALRGAARRVSTVAGDTWQQTKETAGTARERTEFFLRENPIPTVLGALTLGLAIGLAIRYASSSDDREEDVKSKLADVNWSALSLPFLWPFFKTVRQKFDDSSEAVRDGVERMRDVDVNRYVKPLRKKWRAWTN